MGIKTTLSIALLALSGCQFDSSGKDDGAGASDGGSEPDGLAPTIDAAVVRYGFSSDFEKWSVPESGSANGFRSVGINLGLERWSLLDLDGDGSLELVQTINPANDRAFEDETGQFWKVYASESSGFVSTHNRYALPEGPTFRGFYTSRLEGSSSWALLDIVGDSRLDLVQLTDPASGNTWLNEGSKAWKVFPGAESGFGSEQFFSVPDLGPETLEALERCDGVGCWSITDIDGDGQMDLVHSSSNRGVGVFTENSNPRWHIYRLEGAGFSADFITWTVPSNADSAGFFAANNPGKWELLDLDLDGSPELVQTKTADGEPIYEGTQLVWRSFSSGTTGFAQGESWIVPTSSARFDSVNSSALTLRWSTMDINNDGTLDLVHTANSSGDTDVVWGAPGEHQWKVYLGTARAFASSPTAWPIPKSGAEEGFFAVRGGDGAWTTMDIDGDGQSELVQSEDPTSGAVWMDNGGPYWRVYRRAE